MRITGSVREVTQSCNELASVWPAERGGGPFLPQLSVRVFECLSRACLGKRTVFTFLCVNQIGSTTLVPGSSSAKNEREGDIIAFIPSPGRMYT